MTETFLDFQARAGGKYDPPAELADKARPFESWEACPTLFRSPGPAALKAWFDGTLEQLAHSQAPYVWLTNVEEGTSPTEAREFGVLAVLQPFHLQPCQTREEGSFLGLNLPFKSRTTHLGLGKDAVVWVPPSAIGRSIRWAHISTAREAEAFFGPHVVGERSTVLARLNAYLDEVAAVAAAGASPDDVQWYNLPLTERREILRTYGIHGRWTT
jgi:hypothetical protein